MPAGVSFVAGGNINPRVFVKVDPSADFQVLQAAAGDEPIGIAFEGTRQPPGVLGSDGFAAHLGESIGVYQEGDECELVAGGTVAAGDLLAPNASGQGITLVIATGVNHYGAKALQSGVSGDVIRVKVVNVTFKSP